MKYIVAKGQTIIGKEFFFKEQDAEKWIQNLIELTNYNGEEITLRSDYQILSWHENSLKLHIKHIVGWCLNRMFERDGMGTK